MAYALLLYAELADHAGTLDRIEIHQDGYGGAASQVWPGLPFIRERYGDESDDLDTPLRDSQHTVALIMLNGSAAFAQLQAIKNGGGREYLMIHKRGGTPLAGDGTEHWRGYVIPRFSTTDLSDDTQTVVLQAKDRVKSLSLQTYPYAANGQDAASVIIAELLSDTGHLLSFEDESLFSPDAHVGDPLDLLIDRGRFRELRGDKQGFNIFDSAAVLETLLRAFGLSCVQYGGAWHLSYPGAHYTGGTVTRRAYDTAGAKTGTTTPASFVDQTDAEWVFGTGVVSSRDPVREARVSYAYGPVDIGDLVNGNFATWSPDDINQAEGWSYTSPTSSGFFRRGGYLPASPEFASDSGGPGRGVWALEIKGSSVAEGSDDDTFAAASTEFAYQSAGSFAAGTEGIRFSFWHGVRGFPGVVRLARNYYRWKWVIGGVTYFWDKSLGWRDATTLTEAQKRVQVDGPDDPSGNPTHQLNIEGQQETGTLAQLPGTGAGVLTLELGQCVYPDIIPAFGGSQDLYAVFDLVAIDRGGDTDAGGGGITYIVADGAVDEGKIYQETLLIGDGPFDGAKGAILLPDTSLAGDWKRAPAGAAMPHTELIAAEIMRNRRGTRALIRPTTPEPVSGLDPTVAVERSAVRHWPVVLEIERPSGLPSIVGAEILDDGTATTTTTDTPGRGGFFAGVGGGAAILTDITEQLFNSLIRLKTTTLAAAIAAGSQTSCTIVPVDSVFKDNEPMAIVDRITGETYFLTVNGNYTAGGATLNFDAYTFPHIVAAGSYVYHDQAAALVRLAITENAIRASAEALQICTLQETIDAPTERTALVVSPLRSKMKPGYSLMLLSSIAGRAIPITVSADAEAGATTLPIEAASVSGGVGDAVILDGVQLAAWLLITPDRIVEVVEERRKEHAVATLSGEVTGTSVTSLPVTATKSALLDAMDLALTAPNGEKVLKVTINAAGGVAKASTAIPINAANFDAIGGMPAGSTVEQAGFHSAGQHKVASDQIQQRVTIDHSRETWRRELEAKAIATTTATSSGSTLTVSPLVEAIEAGTLVSVLVPVPLPGTGSAYYDTFHRTVQSAAATSATSLVLSASVAANQTPAYVLLRDTSILTKLIAQLASITVNAGDITSLVAQYEGRKIADVNASYGSGTTPATNQTSLSLTGLNEIIEKYDALLIFNLANKRWWEVTANAKLTGNGGSQALTIVSTSLRADPGDPIIRGTMSQLRQDLLGFTMHGKFFKTTGFGGTVDDEGNITAVGSSPGFALGGGGDFAFVQDGDNYVYFDGSDLVVRLGGGGIRINNAGGIEIDGETGKFSGASLDWFDDIDGVKDRVFSIGTQVDLGVILGAYLETQEGLALTLQSDSDISLIAGTDGVITLSALSGTGHIHINPDRLKFFSGTGAVAKPTVTGSRGGNAALSSLLTALSDLGLITDSTT